MNTLFDKIWDKHVVQVVDDGPTQLYIDRLYCHEVTSPQAFEGMRQRGLKCFRPDHIYCMPDHNTPTHDQDKPIEDPVSATQVATLEQNAREFGLTHYGMMSKDNGIIHVVGPEKGLSLPGMTIVCGDSHTSTHGAMGAVAFGIGTSEVEMVMASQCILQQKPKSMRISINGQLQKGVTAKDVALYLMSQLTTSGATGYFVEYSGDVVRALSMEGRLTLCNLSIEMGARGGFIAPDETTFEYLKGREYAPKGADWDKAVAYWRTLQSGPDAVFDKELVFVWVLASAKPFQPKVGLVSRKLLTIWVSKLESTCWARRLTTCSWVPVPMGVLRTSAPLRLLSRVVRKLLMWWHGWYLVRGLLTVRFARRDWTKCLLRQVSRFASPGARPAWP